GRGRGTVVDEVARQVLPDRLRAGAQPLGCPPPLSRGLAARSQMEELQRRGPSLGPAGQEREILRSQRLAVEIAEEVLDLPRTEPQVLGPQLEEPARDPEPREIEAGERP